MGLWDLLLGKRTGRESAPSTAAAVKEVVARLDGVADVTCSATSFPLAPGCVCTITSTLTTADDLLGLVDRVVDAAGACLPSGEKGVLIVVVTGATGTMESAAHLPDADVLNGITYDRIRERRLRSSLRVEE